MSNFIALPVSSGGDSTQTLVNLNLILTIQPNAIKSGFTNLGYVDNGLIKFISVALPFEEVKAMVK